MEWQPIETAPKDNHKKLNYILISDGVCLADLVIWNNRRPEKIINGNRCLSIPGGWFRVSGSRSRICNPTIWCRIPPLPSNKANVAEADTHNCAEHQVDVKGIDVLCKKCLRGWRR